MTGMAYEVALTKAWKELSDIAADMRRQVRFMADTYDVDVAARTVSSLSCNIPAKDYFTIIMLHYLKKSLGGGYAATGEWISFKDIEGGEIYYPAFREGAIKPILRKYGLKPDAIVDAAVRLKGKRITDGDVGVEIPVFDDISVRIIIWKGDDEFAPEATMLYDKSIAKIFPTEDVAVLSRFIAYGL